MAISKILKSTSLSIEVEKGIDKDGMSIYKKKNFSGINGDATPEAILTVADAITDILDSPTRYTYVNESSVLQDNA